MNRDFMKGAISATCVCLLLYGLFPGAAPRGGDEQDGRRISISRLGGWRLPRAPKQTRVRFADLSSDRKHIEVNLGADQTVEPSHTSLAAYKGLGSWIDVFNSWVWAHPWRTVEQMHKRGVETIYLQTATHGSDGAVVYPEATKAFLLAAHRRNIRVVGWYVPSFTQPLRDFRRARAGLRFHTKSGHRFDSFALDIEAPNVDNIFKRNARLLDISRKLRSAAGDDYALGAVIPDSHSLYWPDFPYKRIAGIYDVMVPMGYFTFRAEGFKHVERYTEHNIRTIRKETEDKETPIHVIGGIADEVGVPAARGFVNAVRKEAILGASLYDYPITTDKTWKELSDRL